VNVRFRILVLGAVMLAVLIGGKHAEAATAGVGSGHAVVSAR
jgi:hypothetical protein